MPTLESRNHLCVTPVVVTVSAAAEVTELTLSADEVEHAFFVPLSYFTERNETDRREIEWSGRRFMMRTYMYADMASGLTFKISFGV